MIRPVQTVDAQQIAEIYNHYIRETVVTFEEEPVSAADIAARIAESQDQSLPWLVAESEKGLVGYAYASKWKGRCAYRHSLEVTVYLAPTASGVGWGSKLYDALFTELRKGDTHVVIGGISLPNEASIALHEKFGMRKVGHFNEVGFKFGEWVDVGYWQGVVDDQ